MLIYIVIFLLIATTSFIEVALKEEQFKRMLFRFNILVLILFAGLRWTTGTDWYSYTEFFNDLDNYREFELGYVWLNEAFRFFSDNYTAFLIVDISLAIVFIWWVLEKYSVYPNTSLLLFYSYYYLINYFGSNRRIIAIGLILMAGILIVNHRKKLGSVLIILATLFHVTSGLFFMVFFIPRKHLKLGLLISIYVACFLISNLGLLQFMITKVLGIIFADNPLVERAVSYTLNSENYQQSFLVNMLGIIKRSILFFLFLAYRNKIRDKDETGHFSYLFNIYYFSICFYILVNSQIDLLKVISVYFSIFELILIPYFLLLFVKLKERLLVNLFLVAYMGFQFYSAIFLNQYSNLYLPYYSIFSGHERSTGEYE